MIKMLRFEKWPHVFQAHIRDWNGPFSCQLVDGKHCAICSVCYFMSDTPNGPLNTCLNDVYICSRCVSYFDHPTPQAILTEYPHWFSQCQRCGFTHFMDNKSLIVEAMRIVNCAFCQLKKLHEWTPQQHYLFSPKIHSSVEMIVLYAKETSDLPIECVCLILQLIFN